MESSAGLLNKQHASVVKGLQNKVPTWNISTIKLVYLTDW